MVNDLTVYSCGTSVWHHLKLDDTVSSYWQPQTLPRQHPLPSSLSTPYYLLLMSLGLLWRREHTFTHTTPHTHTPFPTCTTFSTCHTYLWDLVLPGLAMTSHTSTVSSETSTILT